MLGTAGNPPSKQSPHSSRRGCSRLHALLKRRRHVLSRYLPSEPPRALSSRFTTRRFPVLRAYCLSAALRGQPLELRDLAHAELRAEIDKKRQHSTSRDLQEFQEDIGALLPWHQLWAATLLGRVTKASLDEELSKARSGVQECNENVLP